jgi:hypothetical protein
MKTVVKFLITSFVFGAFFVTAQIAVPTDAEASRDNRLNQCAWYKSQAMAAGRKGNKKKSDKNWHLYRECMKGRID